MAGICSLCNASRPRLNPAWLTRDLTRVSQWPGNAKRKRRHGARLVSANDDPQPTKRASNRTPDSTDWIASTLTRRFGLGAGLAWVGLLAFGVASEQFKTRFEAAREQQGTRDVNRDEQQIVSLPDGLSYVDLTLGGGAAPRPGDIVAVELLGKVKRTGDVFVDTATSQRPLAFVFGARPYAGGTCLGLERAMHSMRAGGRRRILVPAELGFGDTGLELGPAKVPPNAELEYIVQLQKVSLSPS